MKKLEKSNYFSEIRAMELGDIPFAAQLYLSVAITRKNYQERLTKGKESFRSHGGMFFNHNEDALTSLFHDSKEMVNLVWCDGILCGLCWYGDWYEEAFHGLQVFSDCEHENNVLIRLGEQKKLGYFKDLLISGSSPDKAASQRLLLETMQIFCSAGKTHAVSEVYQVESYEDSEGYHQCDMMNLPSMFLHRKTGGIRIGQTPVRQIELDGFRVQIRPHIFLWDIVESMKMLQNSLHRTKGS